MKARGGCLKSFLILWSALVIGVAVRFKWANIQPVRSFPPPVPTPSPNGFDIYVAAERSIVPPPKPLDENYDPEATTLTPAQKADRYSLARRRAWVNENARAFELFTVALAAEARSPSTRGMLNPNLPYGKIRQLARDKVVQSKTFAMEGRWREALDARLDVVEMATDAERGGSLISSLVSIACQAIALNESQPLVSHLNAAECRKLNQRLQAIIAARSSFATILQEEKISNQSLMLDQWAKADAKVGPVFIPSARALLLSLLWTRRGYIANNDVMMNAFIAQADKPYRQQKPVPEPNKYFDSLNDILYPVFNRGLFNSTRSLGGPQTLELELALRAYRLEKGSYPANLQQLVPGYLPKLPVDPYGSGETWHYKKTGDTYRAWSIGPDGKDDGGQPILPKRGRKRVVIWTDSIGDVVAQP